jgi:hypothetical protein
MAVMSRLRAVVACGASTVVMAAAVPGTATASTHVTCSFHSENGQLTETGWFRRPNALGVIGNLAHTGPVSFSGTAVCSANGGVPQQSALSYSGSYESEEWQLNPSVCPSLTFTGTLSLALADGTRTPGMNVFVTGPYGQIDVGPGWGEGNLALIHTSTTSGLCPKTFAVTGEFDAVLFP